MSLAASVFYWPLGVPESRIDGPCLSQIVDGERVFAAVLPNEDRSAADERLRWAVALYHQMWAQCRSATNHYKIRQPYTVDKYICGRCGMLWPCEMM